MTPTSRIYLDFNASNPIAPEVIVAMRAVLDAPFGNPSSDHWAGKPARDAVEKARPRLRASLAASPARWSLQAEEAKRTTTP